MLNILKTDLRRMFRSLHFWIIPGMIIPAVITIGYLITNEYPRASFSLIEIFQRSAQYLPIFTGLSAALFISAEFSGGFIKNVISAVPNRLYWVGSKLICAVLMSVIYTAVEIIFCILAGVTLFSKNFDFGFAQLYIYGSGMPATDGSGTDYLGIRTAGEVLMLLITIELILQTAFAVLSAALTIVTRSGLPGTILGFLSGSGLLPVLVEILPGFSSSLVSRYLLSPNMGKWIKLELLGVGETINGIPLVPYIEQPYIVGALWLFVSAAAAFLAMRSRDI